MINIVLAPKEQKSNAHNMKNFILTILGSFLILQAQAQISPADSLHLNLNKKLFAVMKNDLPTHVNPIIAFSVRMRFNNGTDEPSLQFSKSAKDSHIKNFKKIAKDFVAYCRIIYKGKSIDGATIQIPIFYAGDFYNDFRDKIYKQVRDMYSFDDEEQGMELYLTRVFGLRQDGRKDM